MIKEKIIEEIKKHTISFVNIENIFDEHGFYYKGDLTLEVPTLKNFVLWSGWNQEAIDIFDSVRKSKNITMKLCQPLVYLHDGKALNLPLAKRAISYKKPHWVPIVLVYDKKAS